MVLSQFYILRFGDLKQDCAHYKMWSTYSLHAVFVAVGEPLACKRNWITS